MPISGNGSVVTGLGGSAGYGETALDRSDDGTLQFDISSVFSGGLSYFGSTFSGDQFFVNTNGTVSFGAALGQYPTTENLESGLDFIAPFWADIDTRIDGEVAESGQIWLDLDAANSTVSITWENVGYYRRGADQTNLFQLQLVDQGGGDFDIVFRYENIDWTIGDALDDSGARALISGQFLPAQLEIGADVAALDATLGNTGINGLWVFEMRNGGTGSNQPVSGQALAGATGDDILDGGAFDDILRGFSGVDILRGYDGDDWLYGGDGADILNGGDGDDSIFGGATQADLRDIVYAGDGDDFIDTGYGNDLVYGGAGADQIQGGFGVDELVGQDGNDVLTGGAFSDLVFGGNDDDFINGGFGHDRLNGGTGADRFYHLGIFDHGSDWIQDYSAVQGDVLFFGDAAASALDFQVNYADTPNAGVNGVSEAFVIYKNTGQIIWALVDGANQTELNLKIGADIFDLLA